MELIELAIFTGKLVGAFALFALIIWFAAARIGR